MMKFSGVHVSLVSKWRRDVYADANITSNIKIDRFAKKHSRGIVRIFDVLARLSCAINSG
jgi:hypothetical protein